MKPKHNQSTVLVPRETLLKAVRNILAEAREEERACGVDPAFADARPHIRAKVDSAENLLKLIEATRKPLLPMSRSLMLLGDVNETPNPGEARAFAGIARW